MSIIANRPVVQGDDLYRIAAEIYGDPAGAALLMRANKLTDPVIQVDQILVIPSFDVQKANGGILISQNNPTGTTSF